MDERKVFANGVHDISNDDYHDSSGLSRSALMDFKRSPYHYQQRHRVRCVRRDPTPAMVMGELIHTMVLEPHLIDERFVVRPAMDRRTKAGKEVYGAHMMRLQGRHDITQEQREEAEAISGSVFDHDVANILLRDCQYEKSIYFTHEPTGIQCKARPDAWKGSMIMDLKTTQDADLRAFQSSAYKYGYYLQAGMIACALRSLGKRIDKFVFVAVEKEPPYAVGVYMLDDEALDYGILEFDALMKHYAFCFERDEWPGYQTQHLTVPGWAKNLNGDEE